VVASDGFPTPRPRFPTHPRPSRRRHSTNCSPFGPLPSLSGFLRMRRRTLTAAYRISMGGPHLNHLHDLHRYLSSNRFVTPSPFRAAVTAPVLPRTPGICLSRSRRLALDILSGSWLRFTPIHGPMSRMDDLVRRVTAMAAASDRQLLALPTGDLSCLGPQNHGPLARDTIGREGRCFLPW